MLPVELLIVTFSTLPSLTCDRTRCSDLVAARRSARTGAAANNSDERRRRSPAASTAATRTDARRRRARAAVGPCGATATRAARRRRGRRRGEVAHGTYATGLAGVLDGGQRACIHHRVRAAAVPLRRMQLDSAPDRCAAVRASSTLNVPVRPRAVWLDDLTAERDPHDYDLCERHTARLSVPERLAARRPPRRRELFVRWPRHDSPAEPAAAGAYIRRPMPDARRPARVDPRPDASTSASTRCVWPWSWLAGNCRRHCVVVGARLTTAPTRHRVWVAIRSAAGCGSPCSRLWFLDVERRLPSQRFARATRSSTTTGCASRRSTSSASRSACSRSWCCCASSTGRSSAVARHVPDRRVERERPRPRTTAHTAAGSCCSSPSSSSARRSSRSCSTAACCRAPSSAAQRRVAGRRGRGVVRRHPLPAGRVPRPVRLRLVLGVCALRHPAAGDGRSRAHRVQRHRPRARRLGLTHGGRAAG